MKPSKHARMIEKFLADNRILEDYNPVSVLTTFLFLAAKLAIGPNHQLTRGDFTNLAGRLWDLHHSPQGQLQKTLMRIRGEREKTD